MKAAAMILVIITTLAPLGAEAAMGQEANRGITSANQMAYAHAKRCAAANLVAAGFRRDRHDEASATRFEGHAQQAFNAAVRLGQTLGLSRTQIDRDLAESADRELPRLMQDAAYAGEVASVCRNLGMM